MAQLKKKKPSGSFVHRVIKIKCLYLYTKYYQTHTDMNVVMGRTTVYCNMPCLQL